MHVLIGLVFADKVTALLSQLEVFLSESLTTTWSPKLERQLGFDVKLNVSTFGGGPNIWRSVKQHLLACQINNNLHHII